MKKILFSVLALAMAAFSFTSCEDVPAPYDDPNAGGGGEVVLPEGVLLDQSFTNSLGNFTSISASGSLKWYNDYSSAMVTGYQDFNGDGQKENQAGVTYLVSPEIDLAGVENAYITINHSIKYERSDINTNNTILISKDFSGDVNTATWEALTYNTDGLNANGSTFDFYEKSVNIPTSYMGSKIVIALRHTCNDTQSSTWEVKSLKVQKGQAPEEGGSELPAGTYLEQDFSSTLGTFTSQAASGSLKWYNDYSSAMVTGFQDFNGDGTKENQAGVTYLVSPEIDLTSATDAYITINHAINYEHGDINANNSIVISKDYNGDVKTATWKMLEYDTNGLGSSFTFMEKSVNIPAEFIGSKVVVALRHTCDDSQSSTWEVKKLSVKAGSVDEQPSGDTGDLTAANGNFETWVSGLPNNWSTTSTAGNATLSMSTDAHSGSYSVKVGGDSKYNKRISYKEMELKAGEYTMTFYAKAATATGASVRPGYVPVTDGKVGNYFYGDYTNDITNSEWVKVTHTFTIDADGTYCVLIMNSKNPGGDVLIDDFTLSMGETVIIK